MTKTVVVKKPGRDRVPFLRGILVQSLLSAGLSFKEAYDTARAVRKSLANEADITIAALGTRVAEQLEHDFNPAVRHNHEVETERQQGSRCRLHGFRALS